MTSNCRAVESRNGRRMRPEPVPAKPEPMPVGPELIPVGPESMPVMPTDPRGLTDPRRPTCLKPTELTRTSE